MLFIIIPYRKRKAHLQKWLECDPIVQLLKKPHVQVIIAEQADNHRLFNRGAVLNAAVLYLLAHGATLQDKVLFHDVDLIPTYAMAHAYIHYPGDVVHFGCNFTRYSGKHYLGGVVRMQLDTFMNCGGYPNQFFGWGGEDDILYRRICCKHVIVRPRDLGLYIDLEHKTWAEKNIELKQLRAKCMNKRELMATCHHDTVQSNTWKVYHRKLYACNVERVSVSL